MKRKYKMKMRIQFQKKVLLLLLLISATFVYGQESDKKAKKDLKNSEALLSDASISLQKEKFVEAEAEYRKAISLNPKSEVGTYNLGNAYYGKAMNESAKYRFEQAAKTATDKKDKHRAFHNLGNTLMNEKNYGEAIEAYKSALRNNPSDNETRYNLALAKELLEENPPEQKDENGDNKKEDQKDDKKNEDKKDKNDEGNGDDGDQDKDKEQDKGDEKEDKKDGDQDKDKGKPDAPKDPKEEVGEQDKPQQPIPGKLSPQQVKSLLEAMNNEEKKVQDKINAKKEKGAKIKTNKDW